MDTGENHQKETMEQRIYREKVDRGSRASWLPLSLGVLDSQKDSKDKSANLEEIKRSYYGKAVRFLQDLNGGRDRPAGGKGQLVFMPCMTSELSAIYFFADNPDIFPFQEGELTQDNKEDLKEIFERLDQYFDDQEEEITLQNVHDIFREFVESQPVEINTEPGENNKNFPLHCTSAFPKNYWLTTSLEGRMFFQGDVPPFTGAVDDNKLVSVKAGTKPKKKGSAPATELTNKIGISFARLEKEGIHVEHLEPEDEAIHNGMLSLWKEGNTLVSVPQIYRAAVKNKNRKPTEKEVQNIIESIERMRKTDVVYDNKASAAQFKQPEFRAAANLIYAETFFGSKPAEGQRPDKDCVIINGKIIKYCVQFVGDNPFPVYKWAEAKNQVQSYPMAMVATNINKSWTTIVLETALNERVGAIKAGRISNKIIYENFFKKARLLTQKDGTPYKAMSKRKAQLKKTTRNILDQYIKTGFITSYTEEKTGNSVSGIIITA